MLPRRFSVAAASAPLSLWPLSLCICYCVAAAVVDFILLQVLPCCFSVAAAAAPLHFLFLSSCVARSCFSRIEGHAGATAPLQCSCCFRASFLVHVLLCRSCCSRFHTAAGAAMLLQCSSCCRPCSAVLCCYTVAAAVGYSMLIVPLPRRSSAAAAAALLHLLF